MYSRRHCRTVRAHIHNSRARQPRDLQKFFLTQQAERFYRYKNRRNRVFRGKSAWSRTSRSSDDRTVRPTFPIDSRFVRYNPESAWVLRSKRGGMRVRPGVELAGLSDVGCQRENNEDRYSYWEPASDSEFPLKGRLAIVADGMGGYEGGQEASRIAVEVIERVYAGAVQGDPRAWLLLGFQTAHQSIQEYAAKYPDLHGMGTTCTAMALLDHQLYFAHVGDSR